MKRFSILVFLSGGIVAAAGCADAIQIQPPIDSVGAGAGSTTSAAGGGGEGAAGGGGVTPCESNTDCATPTNVCDTIKGACVECLVTTDCVHMPSTVCSQGSCVCPSDGETWCEPDACVDLQIDPDHCGACGSPCFGACGAGACLDPWVPTATEGAPSPRSRHTAVWTGDAMIVWGGTNNGSSGLDNGAVYDPAANTWTNISSVNAPSARQRHTAVWTGTEMIVWGGVDGNLHHNDGAKFDPESNTWSTLATLSAPSARKNHTAIWTGDAMIVWGGSTESNETSTGGEYDPAANTWSSTASAVSCARELHAAVWDGSRMLVYGGRGDSSAGADQALPSGDCDSGGSAYTPGSGWANLTTNSQPSSRFDHTAVFDGTDMLVWGGFNNSDYQVNGHKFTQNSWLQFESGGEPDARSEHTAVWVDSVNKMIIWGGRDGSGILNTGAEFSGNSWGSSVPTILDGRVEHTAVSTDETMIVWGGNTNSGRVNTGGIYTPQ